MTSPLINRLTEDLGWPHLDDMDAVDAYVSAPGDHCMFVPGNPQKNLETTDAAVILPEIVTAFQGRFDCAVVGDGVEEAVRVRFDVWPTPSLIFVRDGAVLGSIPRVRDWDEYLRRVSDILAARSAAE